MIIYEVNLTIAAPIFDDYMAWLKPHVEEILCFDGFCRAEIALVECRPDDAFRSLRVSYYVKSRDALEKYITTHAVRMRMQAVERFGSQFAAARRIIDEVSAIERSFDS